MRGVTGIEFGPDSCVLARVHAAGDAAHVFSIYGLQPDDARPGDADFVPRLRQVRRTKRFPSRARVVAWGLGEALGPADGTTRLAPSPVKYTPSSQRRKYCATNRSGSP